MLLKVFLVDDEIATREGIRSSFPWDEENFTLVGEAPDGEIALPMIADEKPDVVVTDIRMPFMDGLALSRAIRRSMPWIHIVILSGYSDFGYARQAISLGVEEYLLKPVTVDELRGVLERIRTKLMEERQRKAAEQLMSSGISFVQEKLLSSLLTTPIDAKEAEQMRAQMENLGIHVTAPVYNVLDIRFNYEDGEDRRRGIHLLQTLADQSSGDILLTSSPHGALALVMEKGREEMEELCYTYASSAAYSLEQGDARDVLICIGEPCQRLEEVYDSMRSARHVRHIVDTEKEGSRRKIVGVQEMEDTPLTLQSLEIQPLYEQLQYIRPEDFPEVFSSYIKSLLQADMHTGVSEHYLRMEAALTAARIVREAGGDPAKVLDLQDYEAAMQMQTESAAPVPEEVERLLRKALAFRDRESPFHGNRAVMNARRYLAKHFTDPNLMLQDAAKAAGMSASRFSTVFAQETGMTFTEYLTGLRIAKAKELLRATTLRSSEIGTAVGYSDRHYFSYLFKKTTGMTPSEVRESET